MKNFQSLLSSFIFCIFLVSCTKIEKENLETKKVKHPGKSQFVQSINQNIDDLTNPFRNFNFDSLISTNTNNLMHTDDCCNLTVDITQDSDHNWVLFAVNVGKGTYTNATNWHLVEQVVLYDNAHPTGYVYQSNFYADNDYESCTVEFSYGFFIPRQFGPCCTATGKIIHARVYQINNQGPFIICNIYTNWFLYQDPNGEPCC